MVKENFDAGTQIDRHVLNSSTVPLVKCENISVEFRSPRLKVLSPGRRFRALNSVSIQINEGESLGVVGSSGAGKTTFAKVISGQVIPTSGTFKFRGHSLDFDYQSRQKEFRREVQFVFQNPKSSFDPRIRIGKSIEEPLRAFKFPGDLRELVINTFRKVGLDGQICERYPHELSGGQLQRAAVARALVVGPKLLIADEPASSLDVSIRAQILNLFKELADDGNLTLVLIAHDLAAVAHASKKLAVFDKGHLVESGLTLDILGNPQSEATRNLVEANLAIR